MDEALAKRNQAFDKPLRNRQGGIVTFAETKLQAIYTLRSESEIAAGVDMPPPSLPPQCRAQM